MKRYIYDKSCYQARNGAIGKLQSILTLPVLSSDTVSINLLGMFKLSQLRKWLAIDAHIHIAAWFVKHRWCYDGSGGTVSWDTFIKNSLKAERTSASTLERVTLPSSATLPNRVGPDVFQCNKVGQSVPAHYVKGYNKIWNKGYRVANNTDEVADDDTSFDCKYGRQVARLPNFWNTGVDTTRLSADSTVYTDGSDTGFSLLDLRQIQQTYSDETDREWFAHKYADIMASKWGSTGITNEVDDAQAELLLDKELWCSGVDIHGTDSSSLGNYVGKSQTLVDFSMPPRYFNEHGMIWIVMAVRFPSICADEAHYTLLNTLTADNFLGYPETALSQPPIELLETHCFNEGAQGGSSYGKIPYLNWYRYNNNSISSDFKDALGFPFLKSTDIHLSGGTSMPEVTYDGMDVIYDSVDADRFFKEVTELKHWNMVSKAEIEVRSTLPPASASVYAGANL